MKLYFTIMLLSLSLSIYLSIKESQRIQNKEKICKVNKAVLVRTLDNKLICVKDLNDK